MRITAPLFAALLYAIILTGCKRENPFTDKETTENPTQNVVISAKELVAPVGFDFKTEKELLVRVKVADAVSGERYGIKIYAGEPDEGNLIISGITDEKAEYTTTLQIPAWHKYIYIQKTNPDGSTKYEKVEAKQFATALFKNGEKPAPYTIRKNSGIVCNAGCNVSYHDATGNITINSGDTACFTGKLWGPTITVNNGAVVKICAQGIITGLVFNGGSIYIQEDAICRILSVTKVGGYMQNWSDSLMFAETASIRDFDNFGTCYTKTFMVSSYLKNYGKFLVNGHFEVGGYNSAKNYNYMEVTGNLTVGTLGEFATTCHLEVGNDLKVEGYFSSFNGLTKVGNTFKIATINTEWPPSAYLGSATVVSAKNLNFSHGSLQGTNDSKIKISGTTSLIYGYYGNYGLKICDANGVETNSIGLPASVFSCAGYIATSDCNPEGFGSQSVNDADNDGITDNLDEYPNDAFRAFNSYYPSANSSATLAFEDLWPSLGDYDFNDLAVNFNIQQVLNASNQVVEYKVKYKIKAIGGSFQNGLGFQLDDILPSEIASATGMVITKTYILFNANLTETNQAKAVVICYDSPEPLINRVGGSMFNTIKTNGTGTSEEKTVNIVFANPMDPSKLTINKFNPFIFTNQRRGYEVHLPNFAPTSLATTSLFGTYADRSDANTGTYYKTANGLPWAMLIPEDFAYAKEKAAITDAYNFFDDWVLSNGSNNANWYTNEQGNRNSDNIY